MGNDFMQQGVMDSGIASDFGSGAGSAGIDFGALGGSIAGIIAIVAIILFFGYGIFLFIAQWKLYTKAGRPGWANLIPIYCNVEYFNVAWGNGAYFLLMLIPGINILVGIISVHKLSESFGHGIGYTIGMFLLPWLFLPILAFGKSKHVRYQEKLAKEAEKEAAFAAYTAQKEAEAAKAAAAEAPAEIPAEAPAEAPAEEPVAEAPAETPDAE